MNAVEKIKLVAARATQKNRNRQTQALAAQQELAAITEAAPKALVIPFRQPWPEALRACPLSILRSALFGVVRRGRRGYLDDIEIAAWKDVRIRYQGEHLDQADLDVWMQAVHLFRYLGLGERLHISAHSFLKAIGRATGKSQHDCLKKSFKRLIACAVEISVGRYSYVGNLVQEFWLDKETGHYVLSINPHLAALFADGYSHVERAHRQALGSKDLAKWLLGYVSTHRATVLNPHRIGLEKLQKLSGAEMRAKDFKYWMRRYMDQLRELGAVTAWRFTGADDDTLEFIKPPKRKQRKSK